MDFVILDLEWNNSFIKKSSEPINEIIEFGAVKFDENFNITDVFSRLVKQEISKYICNRTKKLTHLTIKDLKDSGKPFTEVLLNFIDFLGNSVLLSWSKADLIALMDNYNYYYGTKNLFFIKRYADLQLYCQKELGLNDPSKMMGLSTAAEMLNINQEGFNHHRALDDSKLTLECFKKLYNKERFEKSIEITDKKYFEKLAFKPYYSSDLTKNNISQDELYILCPTCGEKLTSETPWLYKNKAFRNNIKCKNCGREISARVQFKIFYDSINIKRKWQEIKNPNIPEGTKTATIMNGKAVSEYVRKNIKKETEELAKNGIVPGLAVIIVGDDPASKIYVRNKKTACEEVGFYSREYALPADVDENELISLINSLNDDDKIHGILVQLPLPKHINENHIISAISPRKDVDAFNIENVGKFTLGGSGFKPCTPAGILEILNYYNIDVEGKNCVVVGRSNIVGKPMALLLLEKNATVTICHSKTNSLENFTKSADILISAVGKPKFIKESMVKDNAIVIDVGMNRDENGKLCGDVDFENVSKIASYITPVPGGVGPMTISMLLKNTLYSTKTSIN